MCLFDKVFYTTFHVAKIFIFLMTAVWYSNIQVYLVIVGFFFGGGTKEIGGIGTLFNIMNTSVEQISKSKSVDIISFLIY